MQQAYSYSRINTFKCPYRWKRLYIDKAKEPKGDAAEIGGAIHGLTAQYRRECIERSRDHIPGWFDDPVADAVSGKSEAVAQGIRDGIEKFIDGPMFRLPEAKGYRVEEKWAFNTLWQLYPDWFGKHVFFRAIADFITIEDGLVTIIDDKTGWASGGYDELQLKIYAFCALKAMEKVEGVALQFNLIGQQRVEDVGYWSANEIPYFGQEIMDKISEIENHKDWSIANPECGACGYCGFRDECPAMNQEWAVMEADKKPVFAIQTREDAQRAVQCYVMVEQRMKDLREKLNEWVTKNGPVKAYGQVAERRKQKNWKADNDAIISALLENDVPSHIIDQSVNLSLTTVKKILKEARRMDALEDVLAVGEMSEITKPVGFYKAKDAKNG